MARPAAGDGPVRRATVRGLQALAAALLACAAIGQAGRWWDWADGLNNFAHLRLAAALACGLLLILHRPSRRSGLVVAALALVLDGPLVLPELAPRPVGRPDGAPALRLVQFNAWKGSADPGAAARWILAQDADVVVIEEAHGRGAVVVDRLLGRYPFAADCLGQDRRCSTMILSRRRPVAWGPLAQGDPENRQALSALWARYRTAGGAYTVVAVHLNRPWPYEGYSRDRTQLRAFLRGRPTDEVVMAGDFNMAPWSFGFRRLTRSLGLTRLTPAIPTWPSALHAGFSVRIPLMPLDHVVAGKAWGLAAARRGPPLGSDHRPWTVELARR